MITQVRHVRQEFAVQRVVIDPNRVSRRNPEWAIVGLEELEQRLSVGESVLVVQPDEDGSNFISSAVVADVNDEFGLFYLSVDWQGFHTVSPHPARPRLRSGGVRSIASRTTRGSVRNARVQMASAA